jgi:dihydroorotate dehydrogenase
MVAGDSMELFTLVRPLLFRVDPETAHKLIIAFLKRAPRRAAPKSDHELAVSLAGLSFPNPVGLAAGFDKDGQVPRQMPAFGFGSVEIGTLTPRAQSGNPRPRLFRLAEDQAVINRMGFNNGGLDAAFDRLSRHRPDGLLGINVGANKDSDERIGDYVEGVRKMAPLADYLTINISSPNTPGLRALQGGEALDTLLAAVSDARPPGGPPVFLKVAPDLEPAEIDSIVRVASGRIDALIVSNTTLSRPPLRSPQAHETGGLSGRPLRDLALQRLRDFRSASGGTIPLIGVGGIASADDAYARIRAGASLVQLYSALVFEGPGLARRINRGLVALLRRDGLASITQAVGLDAR